MCRKERGGGFKTGKTTAQCSFQQRLRLQRRREKIKQEAVERIRQTAKEKGIASIYKPEREPLDWVMENKTERKNSKKKKDKQMGEKDETMEGFIDELRVDRERKRRRGREKGEERGGGGIHLP